MFTNFVIWILSVFTQKPNDNNLFSLRKQHLSLSNYFTSQLERSENGAKKCRVDDAADLHSLSVWFLLDLNI